MKQAKIYYKDILAGLLTEGDDGYEFYYLPEYIESENAKPVSLTLPLQKEVYRSSILFPFSTGSSRKAGCWMWRYAIQQISACLTECRCCCFAVMTVSEL